MKAVARLALCSCMMMLDAHEPPVYACGGPDVTDVGEVLEPPRSLVDGLLSDDWEGFDLPDFRFLHPFELAGRDPRGLFSRAFAFSGDAPETPPTEVDVDLAPFLKAVGAADLSGAERAARAVVQEVLDMPSPVAAASGPALQRAVEFLELAPALAGVAPPILAQFFVQRQSGPLGLPDPLRDAQRIRESTREALPALLAQKPTQLRAASLELVRLSERVHHDLPDGWPGQIAAPAPVWDALERGYDTWLSAHASHPLADLARLAKLRVLYLRGDAVRAWDLLLGMYPRHMLRVAWEMRHLLLADLKPSHVDLTKLKDPVLATALVRESNELTSASWSALWKVSLAAGGASWAENLQERLFIQSLRLAALGKAPKDLPVEAKKSSARWATLHAAALGAAGRPDEALAQLRTLDLAHDRIAAALATQMYLKKCELVHAAEMAQKLGAEPLRYVLDVLVDDAALRSLSQRADTLGTQAARALAMRLVADHDWTKAADVWRTRKGKDARAWLAAERLAADPSADGRIAFARFLLGAGGVQLYPDVTRAYSRGLKSRLASLDHEKPPALAPAGCGIEQERERLVYVLVLGGRRERALDADADALSQLDPAAKRARALLKEADALYNKLLNWDVSGEDGFPALLSATTAANRLRDAGKRVRGATR